MMNQEEQEKNERLAHDEGGDGGCCGRCHKEERDECPKCQEYLNGWKRAQADYSNLKKEYEKARGEISQAANENLLYELLPAIDQFETALSYLPDTDELPEQSKKRMDNWLSGIKAVKQLWEQTFKEIGLTNVPTDKFDPAMHEAVSSEEDPEKPPDAILKVLQPGWLLRGKAIRPAKVIVNDPKSKNQNSNIPS